MSFVSIGGEGASARPTYFEVYAACKLVPSLKAAILFSLSVLAQRRSWLQRALAYEDEVLAVASLLLDRHSLATQEATFAEGIYGLRRAPSGGGRLSTAQRRLSLLFEVALPYLRAKAQRLYSLHAGSGVLGLALQRRAALMQQQQVQQTPHGASGVLQRVAQQARLRGLQAFLASYPYVHAATEAVTFSYHLAYMLGAADVHSFVFQRLGIQLQRVTAQDAAELEARKRRARDQQLARAASLQAPLAQRGATALLKLRHAATDNVRTALILSVFGFKILEWWFTSAEERLSAGAALPPPPPPKAPHPHPQGVGLPASPGDCPLCRRPRSNPAQVATSGYVFCYPCAFAYVAEHGRCPVSWLPAGLEHLRKLYDAM